jgi:hypothetical protein
MMGLDDLIAGIATPLIQRLFPDPAQKAQAELELLKLQQEGQFKDLDNQLQLNLAQVGSNNAEAASESIFKSGWRPAVGWVCVSAFAYAGLGRPLIPFIAGLFGHEVPSLPPIDDVFTQLLFGMLGLGGLRSYEKIKSAT